jgi:hypothetical protein
MNDHLDGDSVDAMFSALTAGLDITEPDTTENEGALFVRNGDVIILASDHPVLDNEILQMLVMGTILTAAGIEKAGYTADIDHPDDNIAAQLQMRAELDAMDLATRVGASIKALLGSGATRDDCELLARTLRRARYTVLTGKVTLPGADDDDIQLLTMHIALLCSEILDPWYND